MKSTKASGSRALWSSKALEGDLGSTSGTNTKEVRKPVNGSIKGISTRGGWMDMLDKHGGLETTRHASGMRVIQKMTRGGVKEFTIVRMEANIKWKMVKEFDLQYTLRK